MFIKRIFSILLAFLLIISFTGCMNRDDDENPSDITGQDELVIYHNSTDLAPMLMALTEEYSKATGKKLTAKLSGNDFLGEIESKKAEIYVVDTDSDLSKWYSGGFFSDFLNETGFSSVTTKIPSGLQLNPEGIGSYGIPLMLEGYGYIFDKNMLEDLFGKENSEALAEDLKKCSFTEFEGFVAAVDTYISAPSGAKITLNGKSYAFLPEKTGKAALLTGVFSLNSESTRTMEHLLSAALSAKFQSRYDVMTAPTETVSATEDIFAAYMEVLDLHTSYIAGAKGSISRGDEFVGGDYNYSTSIDLFTKGNALFYPGGTFDRKDFELSTEGFGEKLDIIPMKLPLTDENITAAGMTAEKLQSSIVISSRYYLAVNPKASENTLSIAKDFINWLYNDETGKTAYSNIFGGIPFNYEYLMGENSSESSSNEQSKSAAENFKNEENPSENIPETLGPMNPSHKISNSLMNSVAKYYAEGNWIPNLSFSLPADFIEKILGEGLSDFWGMETWSDSDRKNFTDIVINGWKDRINNENSAVG